MIIKKEFREEKRIVFATEYESIRELVKDCQTKQINKTVFIPDELASIKGTPYFTKTKNYEEAEQLLLNGWTDGTKQILGKLKGDLNKRQTKKSTRMINNVVGFQPNVPRYLQGIPTNMIDKKVIPKKQKVVSLVKAITYAAKIKANTIMEDSKKFIQMIQEIESKGIRVNAYVYFYSVNNEEQNTEDNEEQNTEDIGKTEELFIRVKIKDAKERLNVSKMSFPLVHPSFLRRIIFRAMETEERLTRRTWKGGYGTPGQTGRWEKEHFLKKNEYFIPTLISEQQAYDIIQSTK